MNSCAKNGKLAPATALETMPPELIEAITVTFTPTFKLAGLPTRNATMLMLNAFDAVVADIVEGMADLDVRALAAMMKLGCDDDVSQEDLYHLRDAMTV
jgi:hypothetical protein